MTEFALVHVPKKQKLGKKMKKIRLRKIMKGGKRHEKENEKRNGEKNKGKKNNGRKMD